MTVSVPVRGADPAPDAVRELRPVAPVDVRRTLAIHLRGRGDPTLRLEPGQIWRATRTAAGPATLCLEPAGDVVRASAWGPGALDLLARLEALLGLDDDPSALVPCHPAVRDAAHRLRGLRIGRTAAVLEALVPAILEQKVTGDEARRTFRALVAAHGQPAPGPAAARLRLQPTPEVLARLPYHAFHPLGLERRRAELIRAVAREAPRLERLGRAAAEGGEAERAAAYAALRAFPGIGPWTAAEVGIRAFGDPDAVSVGDFHTPSVVAWALAREPRADDVRMLELLEPYRGQRGRVIRLLELSGIQPPRYGPRLVPRRIDAI